MNPAVPVVAGNHLRRHWAALLLLGALAGLVGGVTVGTLALARRTGTTFDRLLERSGAGDAIVNTMVEPFGAADELLELDGVEKGWSATMSVARPEGDQETYLGVLSGPARDEGVYDLPLVEGRQPDPDDPFEVVLGERMARSAHITPGTVVPATFMTTAEHTMWDEGFGEPDGPRVELEVVGIVRSPLPADVIVPMIATPAFYERIAPETGVGRVVITHLTDGASGLADFEEELRAFEARSRRPEGYDGFPMIDTVFPARLSSSIDSTASVMVTGLIVMALVAGITGLFAVAQGFARHYDTGVADQSVERALGMRRDERALARTLPGIVAAVAAAVVAAAGVVAAGLVAPMGGLDAYESHPGWSPNAAFAAGGAIATLIVVVAVAAVTARRNAGHAVPARGTGRSSDVSERAGALSAVAPVFVGVRFALERGRMRRAIPMRSAVAGVALAAGGIAAVAVFAASVERLADSPQRWGGVADFAIADIDDEEADAILGDVRLEDVAVARNAVTDVAGRPTSTYSLDQLRGQVAWSLVDGRLPNGERELVVGTRVADRAGLGVGDEVEVGRGAGTVAMEVVGVGIGPSSSGEVLGDAVLLTTDGQARLANDVLFSELYVRVAADQDAEAVAAEYATQYETALREPPLDVVDLAGIGRLPAALGLVLATLGFAAVANALVMGVRRRRPAISVLRTIGFTPADARRSVVVMALTWACGGLLVGLPAGIVVGRSVWRVVAEGINVADDPLTPAALVVVVPAALLLTAAVALVPAVRVARASPASLLRDE